MTSGGAPRVPAAQARFLEGDGDEPRSARAAGASPALSLVSRHTPPRARDEGRMMRARSSIWAVFLVAGFWAGEARAECELTRAAALPERIPMKDFGDALRGRVEGCASSARAPDASAFYAAHKLEATPERVRDYVRVRTLFEMTRDGGPWRVRWAITNRDATARVIWSAWTRTPPPNASTAPSATAECDEVSALFAGLVRRTGTRGMGLFWPTWNHTIAAWEVAPGVRVLVPTTQIFLGCEETFDRATTFDPKKQRTVYEFPTSDVPDATPVPKSVAVFLLDQVTHYGAASLDVLALVRTHRALALASSVSDDCRAGMVERARALRARRIIPAVDRIALARYAEELGLPRATPEAALDRIAQ
jgi:hypothetical protein